MLNNKINEIKKQFQENDYVCEKVVGIFSLIANKTRFRILCLLKRGDFCVNDIEEIVQLGSLSNISQQLRLLTMAGMLEKKKVQKKHYYHLRDENIKRMIEYLEKNYLKEERDS